MIISLAIRRLGVGSKSLKECSIEPKAHTMNMTHAVISNSHQPLYAYSLMLINSWLSEKKQLMLSTLTADRTLTSVAKLM